MRPPQIEQALVAYLTPIVGVPVSTRVPATRPPAFVRVTRAGGSRRNIVQSDPRVLVECWGSTDGAAWTLTETAYHALDVLNDNGELPRVSLNRVTLTEPVNYPDEASGSPRYQFIATFIANL